MSTEIVKAQPAAASLPDMLRYAEQLADANLLPAQYRQRPANVLYAMEYGRTLGITPIAAITGIHVIEGKPSASAALISGLVRQAGHKLRVKGNNQSATAQIIRSDDPDFVYEVTWELKRNANGNPNAEDANLLNKDVWKKYGAAMLKARAISQVARDACEEVLFGLHYTPEELNARVDADGLPLDATVQQLRSAPVSEDQWATPEPQAVVDAPGTRDFVREAAESPDAGLVRNVWQVAKQAGAAPEVLAQIADIGRAKASAEQQPAEDVVDAEVVPDADSEHATAVADLRAFATANGINDIDHDAEGALGLPLDQASARSINDLLSQLSGTAA
jgi:hypothetical protein